MFSKYPELLKKHIDFAKVFEDQSKSNNIYNKITELPESGVSLKPNDRKIATVQKCDCGNNDLIEDFSNSTIVCKKCGQVLDELLDENPEWKHYDDTDIKNARCGAQINGLLPQSAMCTTIGGRGRSLMKIIQSWHAMPYKERSLNKELKIIHEICLKMDVTKCIEDDTQITYKMASECRHKTGRNTGKYVITRGKNRISIMAACLYFSCAKKGMLYTTKEIGEKFGVSNSEMNKGIKYLRKLIDVNQNGMLETEVPNQFIKRYCNNLKMLNVYSEEAMQLATNVEKLGISTEHNPFSVAAACILTIAEKHKLKYITKKRLATEFNISDVTISKSHKKIETYSKILFNPKHIAQLEIEREKKLKDNDSIPENIKEKMRQFGILPPIQNSNKLIPQVYEQIEKEYFELIDLENQLRERKQKIIAEMAIV